VPTVPISSLPGGLRNLFEVGKLGHEGTCGANSRTLLQASMESVKSDATEIRRRVPRSICLQRETPAYGPWSLYTIQSACREHPVR